MNETLKGERPIAIFDSGLGGLTVLHEISKLLPNERYIYFADHLNNPYGTKNPALVLACIMPAIDFLATQKSTKMIVIGCNTATAIAIDMLRARHSVRIVGMEPAIKVPIDANKGSKVLLLATSRTVHGEKLKDLEGDLYRNNYRLTKISADELVGFAEKLQFESAEVVDYLQKLFMTADVGQYSAIVLGCTHFIYFKKTMARLLPSRHVKIFDGNLGTALHVGDILKQQNLLAPSGPQRSVEFYQTGGATAEPSYQTAAKSALRYLAKI